MKKLEDWYFDSFKPWFMVISKYIGILTIFVGIPMALSINLDKQYIIEYAPLLWVLVFIIDYGAKDSRLKRRIEELVSEEPDDIIMDIITVKEGANLNNYPVRNGIIARTASALYKEGLYRGYSCSENTSDDVDGMVNVHKKIEEAIKNRYSRIKKKMEINKNNSE